MAQLRAMTLETSGLRLNTVITIYPKATRQHVWSEILVEVSPAQLKRIRKACGVATATDVA